MDASKTAESELARLLVGAYESGLPISDLSPALVPADTEAAYAVQLEILKQRKAAIGGWKVGAKSSPAPIRGAPLPSSGIHRSPATLRRDSFSPLVLELEIAFRFGRKFLPSGGPYSDDEVLSGIESITAAIEIVSSRFAAWPNAEPLGQLADLLSHGALVVGEPVRYQATFPFLKPEMSFSYEGTSIIQGTPANPAGDPRRLLSWVVNHCTKRGLELGPEIIVTTGSYTGNYLPPGPGSVTGQIAGLPAVSLTLV